MVDIGVLGAMEEPVMLLSTPTLLAGLEWLALDCSGAVIGFVVTLPAQAKGAPFHLFDEGSSFFWTSVSESSAGGQSC